MYVIENLLICPSSSSQSLKIAEGKIKCNSFFIFKHQVIGYSIADL
jgi:hypothetical protein